MTGYNDDEYKEEEVMIAIIKQIGKILAKECNEFERMIIKVLWL
jgi:hypothetical protein